MPRVLIVAYGNPLRSDDGVGWVVAEELRRSLALPEVEVLRLQQLLPEVAESLSRAETVIAQCETALQDFVSAEESQRQAQELERQKAAHAAFIKEWEEISEELQVS